MALDGKAEDVAAMARRLIRALVIRRPDLKPLAQRVLQAAAAKRPTRNVSQPLPVDLDSRLELLRHESDPEIQTQPTWPESVGDALEAVVAERGLGDQLAQAGVPPTRSMLFVGPPGVGKTLAARWLAMCTQRPLLTIDLAAVMSSFLGRTGHNIRVVLDYARRTPSVLLLDEFDAIAKRRDDATEIGELKRLVTVLLQAVDEWPADGLMVAATNHPELLDPAVWRRFDHVLEFPNPSVTHLAAAIRQLVPKQDPACKQLDLLATLLQGHSFAEATRVINDAKRAAIIHSTSLAESIQKTISSLSKEADLETKKRVAAYLADLGKSQREIALMTSLSRDTIRKHLVSNATKRNRVRRGTVS